MIRWVDKKRAAQLKATLVPNLFSLFVSNEFSFSGCEFFMSKFMLFRFVKWSQVRKVELRQFQQVMEFYKYLFREKLQFV